MTKSFLLLHPNFYFLEWQYVDYVDVSGMIFCYCIAVPRNNNWLFFAYVRLVFQKIDLFFSEADVYTECVELVGADVAAEGGKEVVGER